jgi:hypothetical protein
MKKLGEALLLLSSTDAQGQETQHMVFLLPNGRLCLRVFLRIRNLSEQLRMSMACRMKQYVVSFVLLVSRNKAKVLL